jgi:hypothetical protein
VAQGYNDVNGKVKFNLTYTAEDIGTHAYKVKEVVPENANNGITYDTASKAVSTVSVSYDTANHKLVAAVNGTPVADGETVATGVKVTNKYAAVGTTAQIHAHKVITANRVLKDKEFTFNNTNLWVTFTTENNNRLTLENVTFSGKMNQIAIGEYRGTGGINDVPYTNVLKNVKAENIEIGNGIQNVFDRMSILFYLRGKTTLYDCVMTGTTNPTIGPGAVPSGEKKPHIAYDCGVPNFCEAEFNNCTIGSLYAWSHSAITIKNSKVNHITCNTHDEKLTSHLTIEAGTTVKEIVVTSQSLAKKVGGKYTEQPRAPKLIIKSGATVDVLDMNGRGRVGATSGEVTLIIEEGATVKSIINEAE